jgi:hypothetical protein
MPTFYGTERGRALAALKRTWDANTRRAYKRGQFDVVWKDGAWIRVDRF